MIIGAGGVVMKSAVTPFLRAARERGCETRVGVDMLFEQVPANSEFLGFGTATPDEVRKLAQIEYWSDAKSLAHGCGVAHGVGSDSSASFENSV